MGSTVLMNNECFVHDDRPGGVLKRIVYPDAGKGIEEVLAGPRRKSLERLGNLEIFYDTPPDHQEYLARIHGAHALLVGWSLPTEVMNQTPTLEVLSFTGIGAGNFIDLPAAAAQGITVCNCPGYADNTVAEHTIALLLAAARHLPRLDARLRDGHWDQSMLGTELGGKQLGLIGFGGIAQRVCQLARAFDMSICVWTRNPDDARAKAHRVTFIPLDELLSTSDFVSLHVALTDDTQHMIDRTRLKQMKPGAILINTGRGELVDETALFEALSSQHLKAAGLDVYCSEPLPDSHPLVTLKNVVLSPHVAYHTPEANDALYEIAVDNIVRFYAGDPINVIARPD